MPEAIDAESPMRSQPRLLAADGLGVRFGGVVALADVSITVSPGKVVGLIGPNGAGKTTFIDVVTGLTRADTGTIRYDDQNIENWTADRRARAGIGRSLQSLELFDELSIRENLLAACESRSAWHYLSDLVHPGRARLSPAACSAARHFGLSGDLDRRPSELPYGRRRLVAIARAVAAQPSVVLLDEPAAGLSRAERVELGRMVRELARTMNTAVLIVEHDVQLVTSICDEVTVLDFGQPIAHGTADEVTHNPAVVTAFLGGAAESNHSTTDGGVEGFDPASVPTATQIPTGGVR
jgi:sulfate-transporting ATPase